MPQRRRSLSRAQTHALGVVLPDLHGDPALAGNAIADLVFGDHAPEGRLPMA